MKGIEHSLQRRSLPAPVIWISLTLSDYFNNWVTKVIGNLEMVRSDGKAFRFSFGY
jgi:hypothetical protein